MNETPTSWANGIDMDLVTSILNRNLLSEFSGGTFARTVGG